MFQIIITVFRVLLKIPFVKNHPKVLKLDKWLEDKIGLDIIKQEKKFYEKYPGVMNRIEQLENIVIDLEQETLDLAGEVEKIQK